MVKHLFGIKLALILSLLGWNQAVHAGILRAALTTVCTYTGAGIGSFAGCAMANSITRTALRYAPPGFVKNPKAFLVSARLYGQLSGMVTGGYWAWNLSTVQNYENDSFIPK